MFSINILCFMSNFSFKGDTLVDSIRGIDLFVPRDSLMEGISITARTTGDENKLTTVLFWWRTSEMHRLYNNKEHSCGTGSAQMGSRAIRRRTIIIRRANKSGQNIMLIL